MKKKSVNNKEKKIWNIPNALTAVRIILTFIILYFIFAKFSFIYVAAGFIIAMMTDFFDGQIARRYKLETEFGRKFDIIADRFLMIAVVLGLLISTFNSGLLSKWHIAQIFFILSREIITAPFALLVLLARKPLVHARFIGKATTFLQGFAFPILLLSIDYTFFSFAPYFSIITGISGVASAITYIYDIRKIGVRK